MHNDCAAGTLLQPGRKGMDGGSCNTHPQALMCHQASHTHPVPPPLTPGWNNRVLFRISGLLILADSGSCCPQPAPKMQTPKDVPSFLTLSCFQGPAHSPHPLLTFPSTFPQSIRVPLLFFSPP